MVAKTKAGPQRMNAMTYQAVCDRKDRLGISLDI